MINSRQKSMRKKTPPSTTTHTYTHTHLMDKLVENTWEFRSCHRLFYYLIDITSSHIISQFIFLTIIFYYHSLS